MDTVTAADGGAARLGLLSQAALLPEQAMRQAGAQAAQELWQAVHREAVQALASHAISLATATVYSPQAYHCKQGAHTSQSSAQGKARLLEVVSMQVSVMSHR